MTLVLLAVLAAAATAFVLQPVFAGPETAPRPATDRTVLRLEEKREQLLLTLAELDFEKDAGKIAPAEHAASRATVLAQAAEVTAKLDTLQGNAGQGNAGQGNAGQGAPVFRPAQKGRAGRQTGTDRRSPDRQEKPTPPPTTSNP